jgi:hypothetical protein
MSFKKSKLFWFTSITAFVVALLAAWKIGNHPPAIDTFKPGTPLQTVEFPDGSKLEVYGLGIGEWTDGTISPPPSGTFSVSSSKSSSYGYGPEKDWLSTDTRTTNSKLTGVRLYARDKDLLLSVRFFSSRNFAIAPDRIGENAKLRIELSDNNDNWITGYGPHGSPDDPHMRGVAGFEGWPRTGATLRFRASVNDGVPTEFELPNPNLGRKPEPWIPDHLPHTVGTPDWEITLKEVFEAEIPGHGPALIPEHTLTDKISKPEQELPYITINTEHALGSRGTESDEDVMRDSKGGIRHSYLMPKDEDLFKFRYTIRRWENYPYLAKDFTIFAKAEVSPDGKTIALINSKPGLGITSVTFGPVIKPKPSFHTGRDSFGVSIELEFKDESEKKRIEALFGDWLDVRAAAFTPSEPLRMGVLARDSSGKSTDFGGGGSYEWRGTWYGEINPGQELEIGFSRDIPDETCEIIVSRKDVKPLPEN